MTASDVLAEYGGVALARLAGALVLALVLHLVRLPLVLAVRILTVSLSRVDSYVIALPYPTAKGGGDHVAR